MIYLIMILSFLLENGWSLIFYNSNIFLSCFSLITIFSIYELFKGNDKKYFITSFVYGLIYDITFTNTIFLNALLFLLVAFIVSKIHHTMEMNLFNKIILIICLIVLYRLGNYLVIIMAFHKSFAYFLLLKSILSSLLVSILYMLLLNLMTYKTVKRYKKY